MNKYIVSVGITKYFYCIRVRFKPQKFSWVVFIEPQPYSHAFCFVILYVSDFFKIHQLRFEICQGAIASYVYCCIICKSGGFRFFSTITVSLMSLFCLIFFKNIFAYIISRIINNGHPCRSPLFTRKACVKCLFTLTYVSMFL